MHTCDCGCGGQTHDEHFEIPCCDKQVRKEFDVYTPVIVKPYVQVMKPEAHCDGELVVECGCEKHCIDDKPGCCKHEFTIKQKVVVDIPVKYAVDIDYKNSCTEEE